MKSTKETEPRRFRLCLLVERRAERGIMVREEEKVCCVLEFWGFVSDSAQAAGNLAQRVLLYFPVGVISTVGFRFSVFPLIPGVHSGTSIVGMGPVNQFFPPYLGK